MSTCDGCGRDTKTIGGRCPNCGAAKGAQPFVANYQSTASNEDLIWIAVFVVPGLAALVLFLLFLPGLLVYAAAGLVLYALILYGVRMLTGDVDA